ncbi:hypothetical protein MQE36_11735 [Zhouia spongiae]|uniref:Uncharacterized protein n=1 Tax=Zhouia spongiae TaxID=2202721 RepID=A0ABY3YIT2_9FLAO|nr:hypothetical protein [Zhouia spongiae]UNY97755.1 hypothetical protein MQE36_11735 [Zhouia spongiae]
MNSNEENLIQSLKNQAMDHHPTLKPHGFFKDKFQVSLFYVNNHAELLFTVRALTHLALRVIDPELSEDDISGRNEKDYIRQALTIANRLMPQGEEAFMDVINQYYREEKLRNKLDD